MNSTIIGMADMLNESPSVVFELLSLVWMELLMFGIAAVGYVLFYGGLPLFNAPGKAAAKKISEDERIEKELQTRLSEGDHLAVFKLWQRVKTFDRAPSVSLIHIVESMKQLGKPEPEIVGEIRTAMECNEVFAEREVLGALLDALAKESSLELLGPIAEMAESRKVPVDPVVYEALLFRHFQKQNYKEVGRLAHKFETLGLTLTARMRMTLISTALRQSRLDEALEHMAQLPKSKSGAIPPVVTSRILSVAGKSKRLGEVVERLKELKVKFDAKMLEDVLGEASRRQDTVMCRHLYQLAREQSIPKSEKTYEMFMKGHASDANTVRSLFEEMTAEGSEVPLTEALGLTVLSICATNKDAKLAVRAFERAIPSFGGAPGHALFAALIKVYVTCELYEEACAVYEEQMKPQEVKPDPALSDLLMKAAIQAGRSGLAECLFEQSPGDVAKHVTMIKACGKENNLQGALSVFNKLKQGGVHMNSMIYNCLLDACVQCGDLEAAFTYFEQMKE